MSLLFDALFSSVALSHFMVDVFNSSRPVLLTYLGLTETQIAIISTIYIWASALTQPFFGWMSDRVGPRWLAAGRVVRSEERRVGEEGRSRWSPCHLKKK